MDDVWEVDQFLHLLKQTEKSKHAADLEAEGNETAIVGREVFLLAASEAPVGCKTSSQSQTFRRVCV